MRRWRVGTISMGFSLVLLGIFLSISQIRGIEAFEPLLLWWPLILVVLGTEILLYLLLSKQENPVLKYDFISILFVGVLGTVGIGLTILASTGLLQEVQSVVGAKEQTYNLPAVEEVLTDDIKRVILETGDQHVKVETTNESKVHLFGTYRATVSTKETPPIKDSEDYTLTKKVGNTLYVYVKSPERKTNPFTNYTSIQPTIAISEDVRVEVRGNYNQIDLYPSKMANHWIVDSVSYVKVHVDETSNLTLSASSRNDLANGDAKWDKVEPTRESSEEEEGYEKEYYKASMTLGKGTYKLDIINTDNVSVNPRGEI